MSKPVYAHTLEGQPETEWETLEAHSRNVARCAVALDRSEENPDYLLGRLFAVLETAQRLALGKVNATIRDRFFASASATPAGTFPTLLRNANPIWPSCARARSSVRASGWSARSSRSSTRWARRCPPASGSRIRGVS